MEIAPPAADHFSYWFVVMSCVLEFHKFPVLLDLELLRDGFVRATMEAIPGQAAHDRGPEVQCGRVPVACRKLEEAAGTITAEGFETGATVLRMGVHAHVDRHLRERHGCGYPRPRHSEIPIRMGNSCFAMALAIIAKENRSARTMIELENIFLGSSSPVRSSIQSTGNQGITSARSSRPPRFPTRKRIRAVATP